MYAKALDLDLHCAARIGVRFTLDRGAAFTGDFRAWPVCAFVTLNARSCWEIGEKTTYKPQALKDQDSRLQNDTIQKVPKILH